MKDESAPINFSLKDIDTDILEGLTSKVEKVYAELKKQLEGSKFQELFLVDETVEMMEKGSEEGEEKLQHMSKHSNQQAKIIVITNKFH